MPLPPNIDDLPLAQVAAILQQTRAAEANALIRDIARRTRLDPKFQFVITGDQASVSRQEEKRALIRGTAWSARLTAAAVVGQQGGIFLRFILPSPNQGRFRVCLERVFIESTGGVVTYWLGPAGYPGGGTQAAAYVPLAIETTPITFGLPVQAPLPFQQTNVPICQLWQAAAAAPVYLPTRPITAAAAGVTNIENIDGSPLMTMQNSNQLLLGDADIVLLCNGVNQAFTATFQWYEELLVD